jgi:hypothetical protein
MGILKHGGLEHTKRSGSTVLFPLVIATFRPCFRASGLRTKSLEPLGHILDFATFRIKCSQPHLMRESRLSESVEGVTRNHDSYSD